MDFEDKAKSANNSYYDIATNIGKKQDGRIDYTVYDSSSQVIDDASKEAGKSTNKKLGVIVGGAILTGVGVIVSIATGSGVGLAAGITVAVLGGGSAITSTISFLSSKDSDIIDKAKQHNLDAITAVAKTSKNTLDEKANKSADIEKKYLDSDIKKAENSVNNVVYTGEVEKENIVSALNQTKANSMLKISQLSENISKDKINEFFDLTDTYSSKSINK